ncbi:MAG TPA: Hpt domain-containing protein, partial [Bacillota bacterium]|nr:Hpt domain-containing protein [Bacillota bacterium]
MSSIEREPMLELYLFETNQLLQELEQVLLESEKSDSLEGSINEIFRIMHTIKGSSAMMLFNSIAELAHKVEDLFAVLREKKPQGINESMMIDLVLEAIDFFKLELAKIQNGEPADGNAGELIATIGQLLKELIGENAKEALRKPAVTGEQKFYIQSNRQLKNAEGTYYQAVVRFSADCDMVDVRAM